MRKINEILDDVKKVVRRGTALYNITTGEEVTLHIEGEDANERTFLKSNKRKYNATIAQIAGLRYVENADVLKNVEDTATLFSEKANEVGVFQDALTEGKIDSDFKLKVVKTVKQNDTINGGYVHRNNCYVDYQDYLKATRAAATLANDAARAEAFADATTKLRESGVASGKKKEENIITMPIFMITSK